MQRKKQRLEGEALERFQAAAEMGPGELAKHLKHSTPADAADWFHKHEYVVATLERAVEPHVLMVSDHHDELRRIERGYGKGKKPEDYLDAFKRFVQDNLNQLPALIVVAQRPKELTRAQLKEVALLLDAKGFSERGLQTAWREQTNQDIAATIQFFIRQAALGDALIPYEERVDTALKKLLASQGWTKPQRDWLERIAKQLKKEKVVDKAALDEGQFAAKGGFPRLNKVFDGKLEDILLQLGENIWPRVG